jgi:hypothetical protein
MAIDFPVPTTVGQTYSYGAKTWTWTGYAWQATAPAAYIPDIIPLDPINNEFNGYVNRFNAYYQGVKQIVKNPFRFLVSVNGVVQDVYTPDHVWDGLISKDGFYIDDNYMIAFSDNVPAGSTFSGRILVGPETTLVNTLYPFDAIDILFGGYN